MALRSWGRRALSMSQPSVADCVQGRGSSSRLQRLPTDGKAGSWQVLLDQHEVDQWRIVAIDLPFSAEGGLRMRAKRMLPGRAAVRAQQLHYLRARSNLPTALRMPHLAVLSLNGGFVTHLSGVIMQAATSLRILDLSGS